MGLCCFEGRHLGVGLEGTRENPSFWGLPILRSPNVGPALGRILGWALLLTQDMLGSPFSGGTPAGTVAIFGGILRDRIRTQMVFPVPR